jgi:heme exporter protein B
MEIVKQAALLLGKDLRLELRRRESLLTMFFFGALLLFVFHFSFDLTPDRVAAMAPGLLWLSFLFTGTLGLAQLFNAERENRCLDACCYRPSIAARFFLPRPALIS